MPLYTVEIYLHGTVIDTYEMESLSPEEAGENCLAETKRALRWEATPVAPEVATRAGRDEGEPEYERFGPLTDDQRVALAARVSALDEDEAGQSLEEWMLFEGAPSPNWALDETDGEGRIVVFFDYPANAIVVRRNATEPARTTTLRHERWDSVLDDLGDYVERRAWFLLRDEAGDARGRGKQFLRPFSLPAVRRLYRHAASLMQRRRLTRRVSPSQGA